MQNTSNQNQGIRHAENESNLNLMQLAHQMFCGRTIKIDWHKKTYRVIPNWAIGDFFQGPSHGLL